MESGKMTRQMMSSLCSTTCLKLALRLWRRYNVLSRIPHGAGEIMTTDLLRRLPLPR
jgi:hypothetical protein